MTNEPLTPDQEQAFAAIMDDEFSTDAVVRLGQAQRSAQPYAQR